MPAQQLVPLRQSRWIALLGSALVVIENGSRMALAAISSSLDRQTIISMAYTSVVGRRQQQH
ncbi:hypothetical protein TYRP_009311 [Tyrophagus putrescentiae]|nr:hypothetical protein TYRP_009311 [Tyrophagus putrescentiae]